MQFTVRGLSAVQRRLEAMAKGMPNEVGKALRAEAEIEMTEAKNRTPVDTGALRASGHVIGPKVDRDGIYVEMDFGGPAAPYAIKVHEDMEAFHRVGQAKFLESVVLESAPFLARRVAKRVNLRRVVR